MAHEPFCKRRWIDNDCIVRTAEAANADKTYLMLAPQFVVTGSR